MQSLLTDDKKYINRIKRLIYALTGHHFLSPFLILILHKYVNIIFGKIRNYEPIK